MTSFSCERWRTVPYLWGAPHCMVGRGGWYLPKYGAVVGGGLPGGRSKDGKQGHVHERGPIRELVRLWIVICLTVAEKEYKDLPLTVFCNGQKLNVVIEGVSQCVSGVIKRGTSKSTMN